MPEITRKTRIVCKPLTADRWPDIEALFGEKGACGGCWCMWWKRKRAEWTSNKGAGNRRAFRRIVRTGGVPGIIAYIRGAPVGWCAVEPRDRYPVLLSSRSLQPPGDPDVWSISCLFIPREHRRTGVSRALIEAAKRHALKRGARIVEAYPVDTRGKDLPAAFVWTGLLPAYLGAGFKEIARRSPTRPIVRYEAGG